MMIEQQTSVRPHLLNTRVKAVNPIVTDKLTRLMGEYTQRLIDRTNALHARTAVKNNLGNLSNPNELESDVNYLVERLHILLDRASAARELTIDEGEIFELDLRIFDAESALRGANVVTRRAHTR